MNKGTVKWFNAEKGYPVASQRNRSDTSHSSHVGSASSTVKQIIYRQKSQNMTSAGTAYLRR